MADNMPVEVVDSNELLVKVCWSFYCHFYGLAYQNCFHQLEKLLGAAPSSPPSTHEEEEEGELAYLLVNFETLLKVITSYDVENWKSGFCLYFSLTAQQALPLNMRLDCMLQFKRIAQISWAKKTALEKLVSKESMQMQVDAEAEEARPAKHKSQITSPNAHYLHQRTLP